MPVRLYPQRSYSTCNITSQFKSAMSRVSSQAMILTAGTRRRGNERETSKLHGMTLSSVCSVSVYPKPLLQFNIHLPSYTSTSLHDTDGVLALHLMPPTQKSVTLGRIFASGIKKETKKTNPYSFSVTGKELVDGDVFHEMTTPFNNIDRKEWFTYDFDELVSIPILEEAERVFVCRKHAVFSVSSHEIWVLEVVKILTPRKHIEINNDTKSGGLIYFNRNFHKIGDSLPD